MRFDKAKFFADYKVRFGPLQQTQVDGLDFLLDRVAQDNGFTMIREVAYMLATIRGETGRFQPIKEIRASPTKNPKLWQTQQKYWPTGFFGRGYVQLTHRANYLGAGKRLTGQTFDIRDGSGATRTITIAEQTFVNEPDLVMVPSVSYLIISHGMREGWFRSRKNGKPFKLSDFIKEGQPPDYFNARNIINGGNDRAQEFANFAANFELILRASQVE